MNFVIESCINIITCMTQIYSGNFVELFLRGMFGVERLGIGDEILRLDDKLGFSGVNVRDVEVLKNHRLGCLFQSQRE